MDEDQASIVRYIYEQYANNVIVKDIIAALTEKGILKNGKPFAQNTVFGILKNEKYTGVYHIGEETFNNVFPRIVPQPLFDIVAQRIEGNKYGKRSRNTTFLLRQKAKCGYCGKSLMAESGTSHMGKKNYYYKCLGRKRGTKCKHEMLRKDVLEDAIVATTYKAINNSTTITKLASEILDLQNQKMKESSVLTLLIEEKKTIETAITNVMHAVESGVVTATTKKRLLELEARLEEIEEQILNEESRQKLNITREEIIQFLKTTLRKEPQQMIYHLVNQIVVYNDRIEVTYNYTNRKSPDDDNHRGLCFYMEKLLLTHYEAGAKEQHEKEVIINLSF